MCVVCVYDTNSVHVNNIYFAIHYTSYILYTLYTINLIYYRTVCITCALIWTIHTLYIHHTHPLHIRILYTPSLTVLLKTFQSELASMPYENLLMFLQDLPTKVCVCVFVYCTAAEYYYCCILLLLILLLCLLYCLQYYNTIAYNILFLPILCCCIYSAV